MADFYPSSNVAVFPSAYRQFNRSGKFTSEQNFTNMIKALAGKDSFVVDLIERNNEDYLAVVIDGYYFEIKDNWQSLPQSLVLYIRVDNGYLVKVDDGTTTLDSGSNFVALAHGSASGYTAELEVVRDGKLVNKGYIPDLCDSKTGNWINLSSIFNYNNDDDNTYSINPTAIKLLEKTYIENLIAQYATKLVKKEGNEWKDLNVGTTNGQLIKFENGVPVVQSGNIGDTPQNTWHIKVENGVIKNSNASVGFLNNAGSGDITYMGMYLNNGIFAPGQKVTISINEPSTSTTGNKNGDLWFKTVR